MKITLSNKYSKFVPSLDIPTWDIHSSIASIFKSRVSSCAWLKPNQENQIVKSSLL